MKDDVPEEAAVEEGEGLGAWVVWVSTVVCVSTVVSVAVFAGGVVEGAVELVATDDCVDSKVELVEETVGDDATDVSDVGEDVGTVVSDEVRLVVLFSCRLAT